MDNMDIDILQNTTAEEFLIQRSKLAQIDDPLTAKSWMLTAKSMYPNNFGVQFEAYHIEKSEGKVKEAAKCFSDLITKFQQHPEFWVEINSVTTALRSDGDCVDADKKFLCEMFTHISLEIQHKLLLLTADHCEDTMEHCKLLMLLLQKFPSAIPTHGPGLIDTLLSAEKHSHAGNQPVNPYRKLLVSDLLPLLNSQSLLLNFTLELSQKLLYKLLHKAMEYHFNTVAETSQNKPTDLELIEDIWSKLFSVVEFVGRHLGWEPYLISFSKRNWSKESYWQKLLTYSRSKNLNVEDASMLKQLIYCLTLFLAYCLNHYTNSLCPENSGNPSSISHVLVDAFIDTSLPSTNVEPKHKRRKGETESTQPHITIDKPESKHVVSNFLITLNCWDLLHSSETLNREFMKLTNHLKLDTWMSGFLVDYLIFKERHDDALNRLQQMDDDFNVPPIAKNIRVASILYLQGNYVSSFEHILNTCTLLPANPDVTTPLSDLLTIGGNQRHLHFVSLHPIAVLQYCSKLLMRAIRENSVKHGGFTDLALGNSLVLMQLDWPRDDDLLPVLIEQIARRGMFNYYLFQPYMVEVDILEELAYLWNSSGGQIVFDIVPHLGQRRIGTRGADKGVKEEIKQAIRRQISRCNEPMHQLITTFITQERGHITQILM